MRPRTTACPEEATRGGMATMPMVDDGVEMASEEFASRARPSVHYKAPLRYHRPMSADLRTSLKYRLAGAGAVLFLGVAHGVHDVMHDAPVPGAFLPTVSIGLLIVILSFGQKLARRRRWSPAVSIAAAMLVSVVCGIPTVALHSHLPTTLKGAVISTLVAGFGVLLFWLLVFFVPGQLIEARTHAVTAESLRRQAELARLRASLHPHFLLNTLNAVAGLLVAEPRQARQLVIALGDLLRDSLEDEGAMRSLEQEVEWLRRYAEIFEIRHKGTIRFEWDLAPETLATPLPRLLLQPLLENAVEHGALQRPGGGTVALRSRRTGEAVRIVVSDDGPGMPSDRPSGLGLRLVQDRLRLAYPNARMEIDTGQAGTRVTLDVPKVEQT
jgi:two-component sensor histidine kinase